MNRLLCLTFLLCALTTLTAALPIRSRIGSAARHVPTTPLRTVTPAAALTPVATPVASSFIETLERSDVAGNKLKSQLDATWQHLAANKEDNENEFGLPSSSMEGTSLLESAAALHRSHGAVLIPDYSAWLPPALKSLLAEVDATHEISQHKVDAIQHDRSLTPSIDTDDLPLEFIELGTSLHADQTRATAEAASKASATTLSLNGMQLSTSLKAQVLALVQARTEAEAASAARIAHYEKFFAALHAANDAANGKDGANADADASKDGNNTNSDDADAARKRRYPGGNGSDDLNQDGSPDFLQHKHRPPWGAGAEDEWRRLHSYNDRQVTEGVMKSRGPLDVWVVNPDQIDKTINTPHNDVGPVRPPTPPGEKPGQARTIPGLKLQHNIPQPQHPEQHGSRSPSSMYENSLPNPESAAAKRLSKLKAVPITKILPFTAKLVDEMPHTEPTKQEAEDELLRLQREYGM